MNRVYLYKKEDGTIIKDIMCLKFFSDIKKSKILGILITVTIIAVNLILKLTIVLLVKWVGEDSQS